MYRLPPRTRTRTGRTLRAGRGLRRGVVGGVAAVSGNGLGGAVGVADDHVELHAVLVVVRGDREDDGLVRTAVRVGHAAHGLGAVLGLQLVRARHVELRRRAVVLEEAG